MDEKSDGAWYVISIAAIKAEVHEQTLRHYERLGLISPARKGDSPHSPRLYSNHDIERVMQIRNLMQDLGVNLAGVDCEMAVPCRGLVVAGAEEYQNLPQFLFGRAAGLSGVT